MRMGRDAQPGKYGTDWLRLDPSVVTTTGVPLPGTSASYQAIHNKPASHHRERSKDLLKQYQ